MEKSKIEAMRMARQQALMPPAPKPPKERKPRKQKEPKA